MSLSGWFSWSQVFEVSDKTLRNGLGLNWDHNVPVCRKTGPELWKLVYSLQGAGRVLGGNVTGGGPI
jgi:hypothetical protein